MYKFEYFDNSKGWSFTPIFSVECESILIADKMFEDNFNIDPKKTSTIGCTCIKVQ